MSPAPSRRCVTARESAQLSAILRGARPLRYRPAAARADLPDHVRAASAIRRLGNRLVVVQDDVSALALLDMGSLEAEPLLLPAGIGVARVFDDEHGNKKLKMDLEACTVLPDGRLVAFGSGSSPRRERLVVLDPTGTSAGLVDASPLYSRLRTLADAHGAELNLEGAVVRDSVLWLVQRGHGKRPTAQWNAFVALDLDTFCRWLEGAGRLPDVVAIIELDVGRSNDGVPFGLTDATVTSDNRLAFLACAEDSADVRSDGPVQGCRFGLLDVGTGEAVATDVCDAAGGPTMLKLEGIETRLGQSQAYDVVADVDRPDEPAILAELLVSEGMSR